MHERSATFGATGGALGLSALALAFGACCSLPWAVAILGVGGAVLLARLAFMQPWIVLATLILVGAGFWQAYRRLPAGDSRACPAASRTKLRLFVWIAAAAVLAIDAASYAPQFLS